MLQPEFNYTTDFSKYQGYDKFEYDIILKNGKQLNSCYPNAGFFNPIKGEKVHESEIDQIRYTNHPAWDIVKPFEPYPF